MTLDMYKDPVRMFDDIFVLGLRCVRYVTLTDLPGPLVSARVKVVQGLAKDENAVDGFRW